MRTEPGPSERFVTVRQFRALDEEGKLNVEHFARICVYEAGQPGMSLKKFLKEKVLFGNFGEIGFDEVRDLTKELFTSERSAVYLSQLRGDNCLGFAPDEVATIVKMLHANEEAEKVAQAVGYLSPRPRYK